MKKGLFLFFLLFTYFNFYLTLYANTNEPKLKLGCNNQISKDYYLNFNNKKIKKIEIDTHNYKSWTVNNMRIITTSTRFIPNKLKKKFDATIKVTYEDNFFCILTGKVRHSGDAKDHIALKDNSIIQSLDITLNYGNIRGITRFKLFKPDVRGVLEDVIVQTQILRNFGYLSPRSIKVNTRVNETESVMLFQEKAAKELLEYNKRREGPILEGDQKFFFELVKNIPDNNLSNWSVGTPILRTKSSKAMLSKLTNANLVNKGKVHKQISLNALNKLNSIYLYWSNRFQDEKNNYYFFDYDLDNTLLSLFDNEKIIKLETYNLFMQSTNSHHALSASNRKFYWNSIENYFEPIVYDANPDIGRGFSTTTTSIIRLPISKFYEEASQILDEKLSNIDIEVLQNQIAYLGLDLSKDLVKEKVLKIKSNLDVINNNYLKNKQEEVILHNQYKYKENILKQFNENLKEINPKTYLIKFNNDVFFKCEIYLENCEIYNISQENFVQLLEGELEIENASYQYIGENLDLKDLKGKDNYTAKQFLNSEIFYEEGIEIELDHEKKILKINQEKIGSRAFILNGSLKDVTIIFNGIGIPEKNITPKNYPIDSRGLTGCLSLINLKLNNVNFFSSNSNCEDSLNFINSYGNIEKVSIKNSYSDALDVDFSDLNINQIEIENAKNDCADFSYGRYKLSYLKLLNCGDKAISIGETSNVEIKKINAELAKYGIATKDSSILNLDEAILNKTDVCLAAYNKKQEFDGGFIQAKKINCQNFLNQLEKDNLSEIIIEQKNKT